MAKQSRSRRNTRTERAERAERSAPAVQKAANTAFQPMERMMQAFMPFAWFNPWMSAMEEPTPKLDVIDRDESVVVRAEVPGVQKGNLAVEASDFSVTIKGEISHEETREEADHYRLHETSRGVFERTVRLPSDVDSTRAKATFKDGVLEVELPKIDRSRSHHVKF
jgi:HSP20 family protein